MLSLRPPQPWVPLLLLLAGCGTTRAVGVARLQADSPTADFGEVRHAGIHEVVIPVRNTGTASARATLSVTPPFLVEADAIELEPDSAAEVSVFFLPSTYEPADGTLTLRVGTRDVQVQLTASVNPDYDGDGEPAEGAGGQDCNDLRADVGPGQPELCDQVDNNCNGEIDEDAEDASTFYADNDGDGYGDPELSVVACEAPARHVSNGDDCDDSDRLTRPGGSERSDGLDQDCDGRIDEHLLTAGALVITEVHPGITDESPAYVELVLGDPPAPMYLQGLEVEVDGSTLTLAGDGVGYASSDDPVLVLCGSDGPGEVDGAACVGPLPVGLTSGSEIRLVSEVLVDAVDTEGFRFEAASSLELSPGEDAAGNDVAEAWCVSTTRLGTGRGSPGEIAPHCGS